MSGQAIDAYCLLCDVAWPISAQERFLIARAIIPDNPRTRGTGAEQSSPLGVFADAYFEYYQRALKLRRFCAQFRTRYGIPGVYPPG